MCVDCMTALPSPPRHSPVCCVLQGPTAQPQAAPQHAAAEPPARHISAGTQQQQGSDRDLWLCTVPKDQQHRRDVPRHCCLRLQLVAVCSRGCCCCRRWPASVLQGIEDRPSPAVLPPSAQPPPCGWRTAQTAAVRLRPVCVRGAEQATAAGRRWAGARIWHSACMGQLVAQLWPAAVEGTLRAPASVHVIPHLCLVQQLAPLLQLCVGLLQFSLLLA